MILVEEAPSNRPEILARIATRAPLGFVAVANGALGFGLAGAVGLRMALPEPARARAARRRLVDVLDPGAVERGALRRGRRLRRHGQWPLRRHGRARGAHGAPGAWPGFESLDLATVATGLGCPSRRIATHDELQAALDEVLPGLRTRSAPLLLDIRLG